MVKRGLIIIALTVVLVNLGQAQAQDDFWQQFNDIMRQHQNRSMGPGNLGEQGMALTQACNNGNINACKRMEGYGMRWCQQGDCTYYANLMQQECLLGDRQACATSDAMHRNALEGWQRRWGR